MMGGRNVLWGVLGSYQTKKEESFHKSIPRLWHPIATLSYLGKVN